MHLSRDEDADVGEDRGDLKQAAYGCLGIIGVVALCFAFAYVALAILLR